MVLLADVPLEEALQACHQTAQASAEQLVLGQADGVVPPTLRGALALPRFDLESAVAMFTELGHQAFRSSFHGALVVIHSETYIDGLGGYECAQLERHLGPTTPQGTRVICLFTRKAKRMLDEEDYFYSTAWAHREVILPQERGTTHRLALH